MTQTEVNFTDLDKIITEKCEAANVTGMALVIAKAGEPVFEKYYGYRNVEEQLPVDSETIFGVASLTKSIAALTIMHLVDQGKLSVDDAVIKWLPEFKLPSDVAEEVKIHHLLSHAAGLPGMNAVNHARAQSIAKDPDGEKINGKIPEEVLAKSIQNVVDMLEDMGKTEYELLGKPGEVFNYSNEGFAMLQLIIERASGEAFIPFVKKSILEPLNMRRSMFLYEEMKKFDNVTEIYAYPKDGSKTPYHSPAWWDVADIYTNGSLKASVMDIIRYLEVYRNLGTVNNLQVISEKSIREMTETKNIAPNDVEYGYGLQIRHRSGKKIVGHGGSIKGVSAHMAYADDYSVALLINLAEVNAENIAMTALHHVLGIPSPEPVFEEEYAVTEEDLAKYSGSYGSNEGQAVEVKVIGNKLHIGTAYELEALHCYREHGFMTSTGGKIQFILAENGDVKGVFTGVRFIPKK